MPFFGISPGASVPLGQVNQAVTFGSPDNFRSEKITFDVPNFNLPYNAILGRSSLAKASSHYAYMVIKMTVPKGPISVPINMEVVVRCVELVHTTAVTDQLSHAPEQQEHARTRTRIVASDAGPIKEVPLGDDPARTIKVDGSLDPKYELTLIAFL